MGRVLVGGLGCLLALIGSACATQSGATSPHRATQNQVAAIHAQSSPAALHVGSSASASGLCHAANVGRVVSSSPTTVHAIRSIEGGHTLYAPQRLLPDALQPAPPSARAAWCWTTAEATPTSARYGVYHAYVVTDGVPPQFIGRMKSPRFMAAGEYPFR